MLVEQAVGVAATDSRKLANEFLSACLPFGLGRSKTEIAKINFLITAIFAVALFVSAHLESTLWLAGSGMGLLEDPVTMASLLIQLVVPLATVSGASLLISLPSWGRHLFPADFFEKGLAEFRIPSQRNKSILMLFVAVGVLLFSLNAVQANDSFKFFGYDVWDSSRFTWSHAFNRLYRAYTYIIFMPAIVFAELTMMSFVASFLSAAEKTGGITLEPFHVDGYGGLGRLMKIVLIPLRPLLLITSASALAFVLMYRFLSSRLITNLVIVSILCIALYLFLAVPLRRIIRAEKDRQLGLIAKQQTSLYFDLLASKEGALAPEEVDSKVSALANIAKHVRTLPSWPLLGFFARAVTWLSSSAGLDWALDTLSPKLLQVLGL